MTEKERIYASRGGVPRIMGIVNVTPDSFSDGGRYIDPARAAAHAFALSKQGAQILDLGAESSRPGAAEVSPEIETSRIISVLQILKKVDGVKISIDTGRGIVAKQALAYGADIINDIYALRRDPDLAGILAESGCEVVLMHMQGTPQTMQKTPRYENVIDEIMAFMEERIRYAVSMGIKEENIIIDPGLGFGKTLEHNLSIMKNIGTFKTLGFPVLAGPSRKSFIGTITGRSVHQRLLGTAAAVALLAAGGADILRVHDAGPMQDCLRMTHAICKASEGRGTPHV